MCQHPHPAFLRSPGPAPIVALLALLGASLAPARLPGQAPVCPHGPAAGKQIRVDATIALPLATIYQVGDSVLSAHGFQWRATSDVGARVTAPRQTWPPGTESEPWHGAESPGLVITFSAFAAHDSTRLSILSEVVCRVSPPEVELADSSVESQLRVLGAVEVVSGLSDALRHRVPRTAPDSATP
jgi:hypothetical protein